MAKDPLTKAQRSAMMARIGPRDTAPERVVRSALHKRGYRFRLHSRELPGTPDIVLPKYRAVIYVHGCFWHRHTGCRYATTPGTNKTFWAAKFAANVMRDRRTLRAVRRLGWTPLVVWECEAEDRLKLSRKLHKLDQLMPQHQ